MWLLILSATSGSSAGVVAFGSLLDSHTHSYCHFPVNVCAFFPLSIALKYSVPYIWLQGLPDAHSSSLYVVVFVEWEHAKFHWCAAASQFEFDTPASDRQMKFIVYTVITLFCFLLPDWANCSDSWHSSGGIQLRIDIIDSPLLLSWHDFPHFCSTSLNEFLRTSLWS